MRSRCLHIRAWTMAACAGVLLAADRANACAVCFGDPDSPMAKGVVAGVFVLIAVVGVVLVAMAGTGLYWISRSRRLVRLENPEQPGNEARPHHDS